MEGHHPGSLHYRVSELNSSGDIYSDIKSELEGKKEVIHVPVYPEMKKLVPDACKNLIPYHAFFSKEATEGIKSYLSEYEHINGAKLLDSSPLFPSKGSNDKPMKDSKHPGHHQKVCTAGWNQAVEGRLSALHAEELRERGKKQRA